VAKGMSPGAALVFLAVGPATNMATLAFLKSSLGKKTTLIYLFTLMGSALLFGVIVDYVTPELAAGMSQAALHGHEHLGWLHYLASGVLWLLLAWHFRPQKKIVTCEGNCDNNPGADHPPIEFKEEHAIIWRIPTMTCMGCVGRVRKIIDDFSGVKKVNVNLETKEVFLWGDFNESALKERLAQADYPVVEQGQIFKPISFSHKSLL
jgi:copper chaperone CopZ